jgi:hypothetical protein
MTDITIIYYYVIICNLQNNIMKSFYYIDYQPDTQLRVSGKLS